MEKLVKGILNKDNIIWNIERLANAARILGVEILYTEQNPIKLGVTIDFVKANNCFTPYEKMSFSCCDCNKLMKKLDISKIKNVVLCGFESHVCVQQTAIELEHRNYQTFVIVDAIGSREIIDHNIAIKRMSSIGTLLGTTESIIFEWCRTSNREEFKAISALIKKKFPNQ